MTPKRLMVIAGEASGDLLAAELVNGLRKTLSYHQARATPYQQPLQASLEPEFFGAGGPATQAAGVDLAFDMTQHAVVGLLEVLKNYLQFRRLFRQLLQLAIKRQPHAIICVDFSGFNRRFGHAVRRYARRHSGPFLNWNPKLIQYVSPQVWASRPGRARKMARDFDLLLSIFPFEKEWYAARLPDFNVRFIGHPLVDRYNSAPLIKKDHSSLQIVLLPGSRSGELRRHLPVIREAVQKIQCTLDVCWRMILPNEALAEQARLEFGGISGGEICVAGLAEGLRAADLAIASTGTVTMECAWFGVPTVAIYKTSFSTYEIGKRIIKVRFLAMPNLLANEPVFPELIQHDATGENIARVALDLLRNPAQRDAIKAKLRAVSSALGSAGAAERAAEAIVQIL